MGLIYMNNAMFDAAVGEFLKAVRHRDCRMARVNSYAANKLFLDPFIIDTYDIKPRNKCW